MFNVGVSYVIIALINNGFWIRRWNLMETVCRPALIPMDRMTEYCKLARTEDKVNSHLAEHSISANKQYKTIAMVPRKKNKNQILSLDRKMNFSTWTYQRSPLTKVQPTAQPCKLVPTINGADKNTRVGAKRLSRMSLTLQDIERLWRWGNVVSKTMVISSSEVLQSLNFNSAIKHFYIVSVQTVHLFYTDSTKLHNARNAIIYFTVSSS